ncbi:MAG: hypothetical protein JKY44_03470 [Flavobacteriaceae bacterium]|nr:hypothetical protein [Flavobacteriaceae bacterium]
MPVANPASPPKTSDTAVKKEVPGISQEVIYELSDEVNNMLSFAVYNGLTVNTEVNPLIQNSNVDDLINAHNLLCKNVAPATPKSIVYTRKLYEKGAKKSIFNRLPLLRNLMILSLFFLIAFIATGQSDTVSNDSLKNGIMNSSGYTLVLNLSYLAAVAGLGVLFYLLKEVSTSLKRATLVPEDSIAYMSQILLGIMAGLIMSEILAPYIIDPNSNVSMFNKSVLALIGGFSSDAIFSILQGMINKIKSIFISPNPQ